ncbi:MAG TPA: hypothetical protein VFK02_04250, partial [Kofleriaceae bacterium]|nr:hypothetical protein [Kofleriaceae bacterium]
MVRFRTCRTPGSLTAVVALAIGCGDPAARVSLVPLGGLGGLCAKPKGANVVRVTAFAASGERSHSLGLDESLAVTDFPADTEQIGVEVIVGGGEIGAQGKSAPLQFDALADRAVIPVMMAPPDGFCELPPMTEARAHPLVARAGDGVLVVGGVGATGPLSTAEYYDPATMAFSKVDVPGTLDDPLGFTGAALATLPDGRVVVTGGPQRSLTVFDPVLRRFVVAPTLIAVRALHAAIATGDQEVLLAGGCVGVSATGCDGVAKTQTERYDLGRLSDPDLLTILAPGQRTGAQLFDLGVQIDGVQRYVLAGGTGGRADRLALDDINGEVVTGGRAQSAALDGGAVLTAFGDDAGPADATAAVITPDAATARTVTGTAIPPGVRLIGLEDGRVAGFGGDPMGKVLTYDPTHDAWTLQLPASDDQTGPLVAPSLVRLADGAVLVLGGAMSPRAWLYRPSLIGPATGTVIALPASDTNRNVLTAPDPASVTRVGGQLSAWLLATPAGATRGRALVGGPRTVIGSVTAIVQVLSGGVALIAQQTSPGHALVAELVGGMPPRLVRLGDGTEHELCSMPPAVPVFDRTAAI